MKIVAFAILLIFAAGDMSLEEESELTLRQQFAKIKAEMNAEKECRDADDAEVCTHPALLCPSGFRIDGSDELEAGCPDCGRTVIIVAASCEEECDACTDGTASATF